MKYENMSQTKLLQCNQSQLRKKLNNFQKINLLWIYLFAECNHLATYGFLCISTSSGSLSESPSIELE